MCCQLSSHSLLLTQLMAQAAWNCRCEPCAALNTENQIIRIVHSQTVRCTASLKLGPGGHRGFSSIRVRFPGSADRIQGPSKALAKGNGLQGVGQLSSQKGQRRRFRMNAEQTADVTWQPGPELELQ